MAEILTQKAALIVEPGYKPKFEVRRVPRPTPGPNDVLVRLSVTSICGSDFGLAAGHFGPTKPVLGHEGVGRIVQLGAHVPSLDPTVQLGQRVGLAWNRDVCGSCAQCQNTSHDGETRCAAHLFSGVSADGTFAQYAVVPARYLIRLPASLDSVSDEAIAPVLCGGVTAYKAVKACNVTPGQFVAVVGVGGVGLFALAYARAMGYRTIGIDINADKGRQAREHAGVDHYIDLSQVDTSKVPTTPFASAAGEAVKALTPDGLGAAAVIVTSGAAAAYESAFGMLAPFATLMAVGLMPPDKTVAMHPTAFISAGWRLMGSAVGTRLDILEALEFVRRGLVKSLTRPARLEDIERLVQEVGAGQTEGKYVIRLDDDVLT